MRIGLFGGSFDPPHVGHWLAAVDAFERLSLDRLDFIPAQQQPLKSCTDSAVIKLHATLVLLARGNEEMEPKWNTIRQ